MGQLDRLSWQRTAAAVKCQTRRFNRRVGRLAKSQYSDMLIAMMYFWSVLHDRPLRWAVDRDAYGRLFRPRQLPSRSQFCRRVDSPRFQRLLMMIHQELTGALDPDDGGLLDGKPLLVGVASRDKDAARGRVMGGFGKGYKLHLWATRDRRIGLWSLMPLNIGEQPVAERLIAQMPEFSSRALTLGDGNYDSQRLYRALEARQGGLLAKPRGLDLQQPELWRLEQQTRHPKSKPDDPARIASLAIWKERPEVGVLAYRARIHVEGTLSNLCSFGGGLGGLPPWVRGLKRVRRWVGAKIILYHARLHALASLATVA